MGVDPEEHLELLSELESELLPMNFGDWIEVTGSLQQAAFDLDPKDLGPGPERMEFVRWNVLACVAELMEMLDEMPWKPWATSTQFDRRAVIAEAVDALHFLGNVLRAVDCEGKELTRAYLKKNRTNLERQLQGYDGKTEKCAHCRRELDGLDDNLAARVTQKHYDGRLAKFCDLSHQSMYETIRKDAE